MTLYVSAVEGHLAPRHGTARVIPGKVVDHKLKPRMGKARTVQVRQSDQLFGHEFFGVTRGPKKDADGKPVEPFEWEICWDTEAVFVISAAEERAYLKEYRILLKDGALKEREKADHDAYLQKHADAAKAHDEKVKAEAAKARAAPAAPPAP